MTPKRPPRILNEVQKAKMRDRARQQWLRRKAILDAARGKA